VIQHAADADRPASWYGVLGLNQDATSEQITAAIERMARQANALSITAPERARRLRDELRAIKQDLLSGAEQRQRYDQKLAEQTGSRGSGLMARVTKFLQTGWTCSTCGYGALPTDKFCPKCGNRIEPGLSRLQASDTRAGQGPAPTVSANPAICTNCGAGIVAGNAFCIRCGARVGNA